MVDMTTMTRRPLAALAWLLLVGTASAATPEPARDFCRQRGGAVLESGNADVHVCCYPACQRCVAVNTRSQLSRLVEFPDASSDAMVADAWDEARN